MQSAQPTPVDVFLRTHPDRGGLRVQVTCGGGRFPRGRGAGGHQPSLRHGGAHILPGRHRRLRYPIRHPPARPALCLVSSLDTAALSGLDYQVSVQHPMFQPVAGRTATVFDGVETILPVMLEPVV